MAKFLSVFTLFPFPSFKTLFQSLDYKNQSMNCVIQTMKYTNQIMECSSVPYSTIFDSDGWNVLHESA